MTNKKQVLNSFGGLVYSTNPDFNLKNDAEEKTLSVSVGIKQDLRVWLEKNHRGGKTAVVIRGFVGKDSELELLGRTLKQKCGTGGSVKDGEIIIQGDHRDKIVKYLSEMGHSSKKAGG